MKGLISKKNCGVELVGKKADGTLIGKDQITAAKRLQNFVLSLRWFDSKFSCFKRTLCLGLL